MRNGLVGWHGGLRLQQRDQRLRDRMEWRAHVALPCQSEEVIWGVLHAYLKCFVAYPGKRVAVKRFFKVLASRDVCTAPVVSRTAENNISVHFRRDIIYPTI